MREIPMMPTLRSMTRLCAVVLAAGNCQSALAGAVAPQQLCCSADSTREASTAVTTRSIYQLDAVWVDDSGQNVRLLDLLGHPVVVAMIYTQCQYACPLIVSSMLQIQAALPPSERSRARFLLVSFDSEHDSVDVLRAYRKDRGLPSSSWILARGGADQVRELAMLLGVKYQKLAQGQFAHSNLITVLNAEGEITFQREGLKGDDSPVLRAIGEGIR